MSDMFDQVKDKCDAVNEIREKCERFSKAFISLDARMSKLERELNARPTYEPDKIVELQETILGLQCRSMKNNLICTGLAYRPGENCEQKLRNFIFEELGIVDYIEFGNVHRFGKVGRNGARPIVARFIYHQQLNQILENAYKLGNSLFGVHEQFPTKNS